MSEKSDMELLREYYLVGSEEAFAVVAQRHVNLVYSVALRQVGNAGQAEEITQAVFIILARKASALKPGTILEGWFHETTRLTSLSFLRGERRRQFREQAYMQSTLQEPGEDPAWTQVAPLLDEAMSRLGQKDRDAVILRFFKEKSTREVAAALEVTEAAAQRRVLRALDKLRLFFSKRGVVVPAATLTAALAARSVAAAPVTLAKVATVAALAKGSASAGGSTLMLVKGALKFMAWTKAKMALLVGAGVLLAAGTTTAIIYNSNKPIQGIPKDWSVLRGDGDQWNWADGKINAHSAKGDSIIASAREYRDITMSAITSTTNRDADMVIRMRDADNGYVVLFVPEGTAWSAENAANVSLVKRVAGEEATLATYHGRGIASAGQSAKITVIAKGPKIEVRLNETKVLDVVDHAFSSGFAGLRIYGDTIKPCDATFSNLTVR